METNQIYQLLKDIDSIKESFAKIVAQTASAQQFIVYDRLIDFSYQLKCAIIDFSLKLPSKIALEHYLMNSSKEIIVFATQLIRECWEYANPVLLYNKSIKTNNGKPLETLFTNKARDFDNNQNLDPLNFRYYKKSIKKQRLQSYTSYFEQIRSVLNSNCAKFDLTVNDSFLLSSKSVHTKFKRKELELLLNYLINNSYIEYHPGIDQDFINMFDTSIVEPVNKIKWIAISKSHFTNLVLLYTLGQELGINLSSVDGKKLICDYFIDADGKIIEPEQLKPRNETQNVKDFRTKIREILNVQEESNP